MANNQKIVLSGKELLGNVNQLDLTSSPSVQTDRTLIMGAITTTDTGEVMKGAGIALYRIDKTTTPYTETYMGTTFTDENGAYGIPIEINDDYEYTMTIYSPLIQDDREGMA